MNSPSVPVPASSQAPLPLKAALAPWLPFAVVLPVLGPVQVLTGGAPFFVYLSLMVGVNVLLAVSLNIVNGMTGQFSLGHAGFMAVGAYTAAIITMALNPWKLIGVAEGLSDQIFFVVALLAGGVAAGVCGFLVGLPSLRLRGDYLAVVTLGFGEIIRVFAQNTERLGGALGLTGIPHRTGIAMVGFWVFVGILLAKRLAASSHGRSLVAIREDEVAASAMGVNTTAYKVRAFVISSFFAGVAGGLFAHFQSVINPASFGWVRSMEIVVMVVAGGLGSTSGSVVAAVVLTLLPEGLRTLFNALHLDAGRIDQVRMPLYGLLLVALMLLRPQGLFGTHEIWDGWKKRRAGREKRA